MSPSQRAYKLLRAYINREWDRIQGVDRDNALQELDDIKTYRYKVNTNTTDSLTSVELEIEDPKAFARQILGVTEEANFEEIRVAFKRLHQRSDPTRFPQDSEEQLAAESIHRRVYWAYRQLTEEISTTEKRFKSLEIE